jgi:zinc transporter, ZIP family
MTEATPDADVVARPDWWSGLFPSWLLALAPLALIATVLVTFAQLHAPGVPRRTGQPAEELSVERAVLRPGEIVLTVRNDGPDPVRVAQISVNDAYVQFSADEPNAEVGRLGAERLTIPYDWVKAHAYAIELHTATGGTITTNIPVATETPTTGPHFFAVMALLGLYVGIVPVFLGMLFLPWLRRIGERWIRLLMAVTTGLLVWLAIDATIEAVELAGQGPQVFGGPALVFLGAALAYLTLSGIEAWVRSRRGAAENERQSSVRLALLIAVGIGLHNLGEGLAIGSAYALGALPLGAFLVIGFVLQNTTEGLAIIVPFTHRSASVGCLAALGAIAGAPAIVGTWLGGSAYNNSLAALLLGAGVGAVLQVIQQLVPTIRDHLGRTLYPASVTGIAAGMAMLYITGLLVSG